MSEELPAAPVLGVTAGPIALDDRAAVAALGLALAAQCTRSLDIVSRHLDPPLYDTDAFAEAVRQLALDHRRARIRLFVLDPTPLLGRGHRLVELAMRLSSFIEIRVPAEQHKSFNEAFLVADRTGYVHRRFADRYDATAHCNDRRTSAALSDRLDEMWMRGALDPNFRHLRL